MPQRLPISPKWVTKLAASGLRVLMTVTPAQVRDQVDV
jgi:hypothetical protein